MDKMLKEGKLGEDGDFKLEMKDGKLLLSAGYMQEGVGASLGIQVSPDFFIDKLAEAIPGEIDDAVLSILKAALKA
jgi:hypothetical protein